MNTRTYEIGNTAEQADATSSQRDQTSFVVELGTVKKETKHDGVLVAMDSFNTIGTFGS
jgi:hypothetical protein